MLIELCTCANRAVRSCVHVLIELCTCANRAVRS